MSYYEELIMAATGCPVDDVEEIEEYMRHVVVGGGTLDHLDEDSFNHASRTAWSDIQWTRTPEGIAYLKQVEAEMMGDFKPTRHP